VHRIILCQRRSYWVALAVVSNDCPSSIADSWGSSGRTDRVTALRGIADKKFVFRA
jgi:hypothetical protein